MPDALTRIEVERIAELARLELTEAEKELFARQLADILDYVRLLQDLDTSGVPPTAHVLARHPAFRTDQLRPSLSRQDALGNAPDADPDAGLFKVPRVIG